MNDSRPQAPYAGGQKPLMVTPLVHARVTRIKAELRDAEGRTVTFPEVIERLVRRWEQTGGTGAAS